MIDGWVIMNKIQSKEMNPNNKKNKRKIIKRRIIIGALVLFNAFYLFIVCLVLGQQADDLKYNDEYFVNSAYLNQHYDTLRDDIYLYRVYDLPNMTVPKQVSTAYEYRLSYDTWKAAGNTEKMSEYQQKITKVYNECSDDTAKRMIASMVDFLK